MQAKNLGQNFLADPAILKKDCGGFSKNNDLVLEIGADGTCLKF